MLTHPLRRVIATCASALLVLGIVNLASAPSDAASEGKGGILGHVEDATGRRLPAVTVRIYRATGDVADPWALESTVRTDTDSGSGSYDADVPFGTYRVTFNELDDGGLAWNTWTSSTTAIDGLGVPTEEFTINEEHRYQLASGQLGFKGGVITGKLSDHLGHSITSIHIDAYDATTKPDDPNYGVPSLSVDTHYDKDFTMHALDGPTKLRFSGYASDGSYKTEWYDNAETFDTATPIEVPQGETSSGHDVVLEFLHSPHVRGRVVDPDGKPLGDVSIVLFEAPYSPGGYWQPHYTSSVESDTYHPVGTFDTGVRAGTYRIGINVEILKGPDSPFWKPTFVTAATFDDATPFDLVDGSDVDLGDIQLEYAGGTVSGRVVNALGAPVAGAKVTANDFSSHWWESLSTTTDSDGQYTAHVATRPTRIHVSKSEGYFEEATVLNPANTVEPQEFLLAPTDHVDAGDVVLPFKPIQMTSSPKVYGSLTAGRTLKTAGGGWRPGDVTKKYRWYYLKGGKIRPIIGGTHSYLPLRSADYGKRFRVRVTASYPGVTSRVVTSAWSGALLRNSSMKLSGSSPSRGKIKLSATVNVSGARATGKVRFSCGIPGATFAAKTVTLKSEKASVTLKTMFSGRMTCRANYHGNSTTKKTSRSKGITVK